MCLPQDHLFDNPLLPLTGLCEAPIEEDYADGTLKKRQVVMELDMATWRVRASSLFFFFALSSPVPHADLSLCPSACHRGVQYH